MRLRIGPLLLLGFLCGACARNGRAEVEKQLGFTLPPSASDFQVEAVETDPLSDHRLVSFTLPATGLETVVSRLPCAPSATGTVEIVSALGPPGPGEQVCQTGRPGNFEAVKLSPLGGERVRVFVETYQDY